MKIQNKNKLLVTIIIPCYNTDQFIGECLESIKKQSYKNWECIIVDDNSNDNTIILASNFAIIDKRFKVVNRPESKPKGANTCRNYGLEYANGDFIKWFDSDDIMCVDHLKTVVENFASRSVDFVITESQNFSSDDENLGKPYCYKSEIPLTSINVALNRTGWITNDLTIKRDVITFVRFNESSPAIQEYNFNVRLVSYGFKGFVINEIHSLRRLRPGSITQTLADSDDLKILSLTEDKFYTALDLINIGDNWLVKWYLAGYMRLSFELVINQAIPVNLFGAARLILKYFGLAKLSSFLIGLSLGFTVRRGYNLVKYARQLGSYSMLLIYHI